MARRLAAMLAADVVGYSSSWPTISGGTWDIHQKPGAKEATQVHACTPMLSCDLVREAGHWAQQEQPGKVVRSLRTLSVL